MTDVIQCYTTFCRVVERGSLSRAALDLDMAQASVSRHLQELERRYGTSLLRRTTRQVQLTDAGTRLLAYAQSILASEAQLATSLRTERVQMEGPLVVSASTAFGHEVVAPFCMAFLKRHPGVQLKLRLQTQVTDLVEQGIDVAIRLGELKDSGLVATPLGVQAEVLVAAPALFPGGRPPERPQDLSPYPRVGVADRPGTQTRLKRGRQQLVLDAPLRLSADSYLVLRQALLAGIGYGSIQRYLVEADLARGRLVPLLSAWSLPAWPVHAVTVGRQGPARVARFIQELGSHLAHKAD